MRFSGAWSDEKDSHHLRTGGEVSHVKPEAGHGVFPDLGLTAESRGRARLVFRDLNRGELRPIHPLEGHQVTAGIDHGNVHLPVSLLRLCHRCVYRCLGAFERDRGPGRVSRVSSVCSEQLAGKFRDKCLNEHCFAWRLDYNEVRVAHDRSA